MCRIMGLSNVSKVKDVNAVALKMKELVCIANRDGFGYSISYKNSLYSEKFINPDDFVGIGKTTLHAKMEVAVFDNTASLSHGEHGEKPLAIIAHGRTSTNFKGDADYSHPFIKDGNAFIHNGVVDVPRNHKYDVLTDNDSEYLANVYWKHGNAGLSKISGYFAFMNLKTGGRLAIARDNLASLHGAYIPELDAYVFATMESMITKFCADLKYTCTRICEVVSYRAFQVQGSKVSEIETISKAKAVKTMTAKEAKAFKDYSIPSTPIKRAMATDASTPSKFNDPNYYTDDSWEDREMAYYGKTLDNHENWKLTNRVK